MSLALHNILAGPPVIPISELTLIDRTSGMLDVEFREWLENKGAKTQTGLNSRIDAIKTIEKNLAALGSPHADLDSAYKADGFAQL